MTTWKIDPTHSEIQFKVKHLMISTVTGHFTNFDATVQSASEDFSDATITFEADVDSVNTKNADRDKHLLAPDFFDAAQYPKLKFVSKSVKKIDDEQYKVIGDLTIRDTTKPIELSVEYGGTLTDPWGQVKAGFELSGKINRKEFGLSFHATTDTGGLVLGDEVKLQANVEIVRQQA